jgi:hypothetical protein
MTSVSFLSTPESDAQPRMQADWLELTAFFSKAETALLDELVNQQDLDRDREPDDFGDLDEQLEDIVSQVLAEIDRRRRDLGGAYPFEMSEDGRALCLEKQWNVGQAIYLFCLILSHAPPSELVPDGSAPPEDQLREARDLFQICSTLAAAGKTGGPSFSVGWPRADDSRFLEKLQQVWSIYGDGVPHDKPLTGTPPHLKDDEIDVISFWPERDGLPGHGYLVGQVASGNNWRNKSVRPALNRFTRLWFKVQPAADGHPAIFIPFSVSDESMSRDTSYFGYVAHRSRLPQLAGLAPTLSQEGVAPIERLDEIGRIYDWLAQHRQHVLGSATS